jgi:hypothetical protein
VTVNIYFEAEVHLWTSNPSFYLVSLPKSDSNEIRNLFDGLTNGFGSLKVEATIGHTTWKTSIFPNNDLGVYDLPLKAEIRKKNDLDVGSLAKVDLQVLGL